jgi:hypothetical protein
MFDREVAVAPEAREVVWNKTAAVLTRDTRGSTHLDGNENHCADRLVRIFIIF